LFSTSLAFYFVIWQVYFLICIQLLFTVYPLVLVKIRSALPNYDDYDYDEDDDDDDDDNNNNNNSKSGARFQIMMIMIMMNMMMMIIIIIINQERASKL